MTIQELITQLLELALHSRLGVSAPVYIEQGDGWDDIGKAEHRFRSGAKDIVVLTRE